MNKKLTVKTRDPWIGEKTSKVESKTTQLSSSSVSHQSRDLKSEGSLTVRHERCSELGSFQEPPELEVSIRALPMIETVTSFSFRPISEQSINSVRQSPAPFFSCCCSEQSRENQICPRCQKVLCRSCLQLPLRIIDCGDCCRKICQICLRNLKITANQQLSEKREQLSKKRAANHKTL